MASTFNHGSRVFHVGENARPVGLADITSLGSIVVAPDADNATFPYNEPVHFFTDDKDKLSKLGLKGTFKDTVDGIIDQGIIASLCVVRVPEGTGSTPDAILESTMTNVVGSSSSMTGVHAFKGAKSHTGVEPGVLFAAGYTSQRMSSAANPVLAEFEGVANRLRSVVVADGPGTTKEAALLHRSDFTNAKRIYMVDPPVKVWVEGVAGPVVKPVSPRVAALIARRDREKGAAFHSPSNQEIGGIVGVARPISYYDGEVDHEANYLNERGIATIIEGRTLWGNRTLATDPNDVFLNVVRGNDVIEKSIVKSFRWAQDKNLGPHLGVAIIESLDEFLSSLKNDGHILGGKAFFDRTVNSWADLMQGKLRVEFEAEVPAPLEDNQFGFHRNPQFYYEELGSNILAMLASRAA